jgi:hypothetical protein
MNQLIPLYGGRNAVTGSVIGSDARDAILLGREALGNDMVGDMGPYRA